METVKEQKWFDEWIRKVIHTEEFQQKHVAKFGYEALVQACAKYGAKVLVNPDTSSSVAPSKEGTTLAPSTDPDSDIKGPE